ncbi:MAG: hypothetical protein ABW026_06055 [Microvirga sp.]
MAYASYGNNSQQTPKDAQRPDEGAAAAKPGPAQDAPASDPGAAKDGGSEAARSQASPELPAAGPHADPALTNDKATPGAGTLPAAGDQDSTDATSG